MQVTIETVRVPDLGGAEEVQVIELTVAPGQRVAVDQTLLVLESEKATMELPSPVAGVVVRILVAEGDKVEKAGDPLLEIEVDGVAEESPSAVTPPRPGRVGDAAQDAPAAVAEEAPPAVAGAGEGPASTVAPPRPRRVGDVAQDAPAAVAEEALPAVAGAGEEPASTAPELAAPAPGEDAPRSRGAELYAGPYVRRLARELGVDLARVQGTGPRQRILKEDVQGFVRRQLQAPPALAGAGIPRVPEVDYARFGPVTGGELGRIGRLTATNMRRNWLNVPHVTQFDAADVTELEAFRRAQGDAAQARGVKLTPVPFILKACAVALRENPVLNRALSGDGDHYVQRDFYHLGMAVDTPRGLLVPVIRDVDQKGIWQLAAEIADLAARARAGKLRIDELQGACFTVTSLGAIGGQGFTPIVNAPEVAILGVSRAAVQPVWNGGEFVPRTLLPLSLSYDHRVVNGGDGGRFLTRVVELLSDIRALLL